MDMSTWAGGALVVGGGGAVETEGAAVAVEDEGGATKGAEPIVLIIAITTVVPIARVAIMADAAATTLKKFHEKLDPFPCLTTMTIMTTIGATEDARVMLIKRMSSFPVDK